MLIEKKVPKIGSDPPRTKHSRAVDRGRNRSWWLTGLAVNAPTARASMNDMSGSRAHNATRVAARSRISMSALKGWKRDADGRMMRSASSEAGMGTAEEADEQPSLLLEKLPAHVLREVFGFLGDADLAAAAATCATFRQVCRSESLWRNILADKLGSQAGIVLPSELPDERCAARSHARESRKRGQPLACD